MCVYTYGHSPIDKSYITDRERDRETDPSVRSTNTHNSLNFLSVKTRTDKVLSLSTVQIRCRNYVVTFDGQEISQG